MWKIRILIALICIFISTIAYSSEDHVIANVLIGKVENDKALLGLEMQVENGWYFYYKDPGDTGIGLSIVLDKKSNISWPVYTIKEQKIGDFTIKSNVYDKSVILPIEVLNYNNSVNMKIEFAMCDGTLCIPSTKEVSIGLSEQVYNDEVMQRINNIETIKQ